MSEKSGAVDKEFDALNHLLSSRGPVGCPKPDEAIRADRLCCARSIQAAIIAKSGTATIHSANINLERDQAIHPVTLKAAM
jgi:hypothetical protein